MFDVIIVLAGGIRDNGELPKSVQQRIHKAKELFDSQLARNVILSGRWSLSRGSTPPRTEAEAMFEYAQKIGIPATVLHKEENSQNTAGNAFYSATNFLIPNNWNKVVVVTSDFHLPRTKYIFDTFLGHEYSIRYESAPTDFSVKKWLKWKLSEKIMLSMTKKRLGKLQAGNYQQLLQLYGFKPRFSSDLVPDSPEPSL